MANPLRILSGDNWADTAIISGVASLNSLPLSNLKDDDIQKIWRSAQNETSAPQQAVIADLGAQRDIGVAALINSNAFSPWTFHVRISTSDPTGLDASAYEALNIPGIPDASYNKFIHFIEPSVTGRYVRITHNVTLGVPEAGRLVICPVWSPSRNMRFGREKLWRDFSTKTQSLGGNEFVDVRPRQWGWRFTLFGLTEAEAQQQVDELNRLRGIGRDILVCIDKDSSNLGRDTVWGLLEQPATQRQDHHNFYVVEFEVWNRN